MIASLALDLLLLTTGVASQVDLEYGKIGDGQFDVGQIDGRQHDQVDLGYGTLGEGQFDVSHFNELLHDQVNDFRSERGLMEAQHKSFDSLPCNDDISPCVEWDSMGFSTSSKVVIPCGTCVTFACDTTTVDAPFGIDVQGKLLFKDYSVECRDPLASLPRLTVTTPFLHVQGELVMTSSRATSALPDVKLLMTGNTEYPLIPHPTNVDKCTSGECGVGKKAVAVAGGKLDIRGLPSDCTTWTKIVDTQTFQDPPDVAPETLPSPPNGCRNIVASQNWNDGSDNLEWTSRSSRGGYEIRTDDSSSYFIALGRSAGWQGPALSMLNYMDCILPETTYYITARLRLTASDGTTISSCQASGEKCVRALLFSESTDPDGGPNIKTYSVKVEGPGYGSGPSATVVDGEWFEVFGATTFTEAEADTTGMINRLLYFDGPESGIDIAIDDFQISLEPPAQFQFAPSDKVCQNLIPFNGDASNSFGAYFYPLIKNEHNSEVEITEEVLPDTSTNKYFSLSNRNRHWSSLGYNLNTDCIVRGYTYTFSMNLRLHSSNATQVKLIRYREVDGTNQSWTVYKECGLLNIDDGWVSCGIDVTFNEDDESATRFWFAAETDRTLESHPDLDFDDIGVEMKTGPVNGLVVESNGIDNCWGAGSELLVTSHTLDWDGSSTAILSGVTSMGGGSFLLGIESPFLPADVTFAAAGDEYNSEVALLSRNLLWEGAEDEPAFPLHGAHLIIYHTPEIIQTIEGLEVRRFGQQTKLGRYPIHFHMSQSVLGSTVSKNLIRQSNQRCVVIHGSHNLTVSQNVAYDTFGHCFLLEDGAEMDNTIEYNLGAHTKIAKLISNDESDHRPSTFWITNPLNTIRGNVAAGSQGSGFWFEFRSSVRGPSAAFHKFNPKTLPLTLFVGNVAHSNYDTGLRTYPNGYTPPTQGLVTFQDTKSYRNRRAGFFSHNSRNLHVDGGTFADNRWQIDVDRAQGITIDGVKLIGFSPEYRELSAGYDVSSHCPGSDALVGVQMHTFREGGWKYLGTTVTNSVFSHLGDETGCTGSTSFNVDDKEDFGYFDVRSNVGGLTFDEGAGHDIIDFCDSYDEGIDYVAVRDDDGSIIGNPGFIVTDSPRMTTFLEAGSYVSIPEKCIAYSTGTCFRGWSAKVSNFVSADLKMQVTEVGSDKSVLVKGHYDIPMDDSGVNTVEFHKISSTRSFFIQVPDVGQYTVRFLLNGKGSWPLYVEHQFEDLPGACGSSADIQIFAPVRNNCRQLIKNRLITNGVKDWWSTNGGLMAVDTNSDNGLALANEERTHRSYGPAQHLDTRCMVEGKSYSFRAQVKMYREDTKEPYSCMDNFYNCPVAYIRSHVGSMKENRTTVWAGGIQGMWGDEWNIISGEFVVSPEQASAHAVYIYFEGPPAGITVLWDGFSITPKKATVVDCANPSIMYDTFDDGDFLGWNSRGSPGFYEVTASDSHTPGDSYFFAKGRTWTHQGPAQPNVPVDCIVAGKTYKVEAMVRLTKSSGNSNCHKSIGGTNVMGNNCLRVTIFSENYDPNDSDETIRNFYSVRAFPHKDGEWFRFLAYFTFREDMEPSEYLKHRAVYFEGPEANVDLAIDNFHFSEYTCDTVNVMMYDFSVGTYLGWNSMGSKGGYQVTDVESHTPGDAYFVALGRTSTRHGPGRALPLDCMQPGTYEITVLARLTHTDPGVSDCHESGSSCLELVFDYRDTDTMKETIIGRAGQQLDGDWFEFTSTAVFSSLDLGQRVANGAELVHSRIYFRGPEAGVDVAIDNFEMKLVTASGEGNILATGDGGNMQCDSGFISLRDKDSGESVGATVGDGIINVGAYDSPTTLEANVDDATTKVQFVLKQNKRRGLKKTIIENEAPFVLNEDLKSLPKGKYTLSTTVVQKIEIK